VLTDNYSANERDSTQSPDLISSGKFQDIATELAEKGYSVLPLSVPGEGGRCRYRPGFSEKNVGKAPLTQHGQKDATTDLERIAHWVQQWPDANVGIALEDANLVDVSSDSLEAYARFRLLGLPDGALVYTSSDDHKQHTVMRLPVDAPKVRSCTPGEQDLLSTGYSVGPGSVHRHGRTYAPIGDIPRIEDLPLAPEWVVAQLREVADSRRTAGEEPVEVQGIDKAPPVRLSDAQLRIWRGEEPALTPDGALDRSGTLCKIARILTRAGATERTIADALRERDETLGYGKYTDRRDGHRRYREIADAMALNADTPTYLPGEYVAAVHPGERLPQAPRQMVQANLAQNEYGDAQLFAYLYRERVLHDPATRQWFTWAGHHWQEDSSGLVKRLIAGQLPAQYLGLAAEVAREAEAASKDEATRLRGLARQLIDRATALQGLRRTKNVLEFATAILAPEREGWGWDRDPWVLGVANGTLNLRDGSYSAGAPADYIRIVSPSEWRGLDAPAVRWERFLGEVFGGDTALIDFLQRLLGYGITGLSTEHVVALFYGPGGRNGKDTLIEAIHHVLGSCASPVSKAVLLRRRENTGGAEPHLMDLRGKRVVWTSETQESDHLDAAQVKYLTGGGTIKTRPLYGGMVEFPPTHLALLLSNYTPHADPDDLALWSRVLLITFNQRFVDDPQHPNERARDPSLKEALRAEASGILAWLVRGCLEWREKGLQTPECVKLATEQYREAEDEVTHFLEERCVIDRSASIGSALLYDSYRSWALDQGSKPMTNTKFGRKLGTRRGITRGRGADTRTIYLGLTLLIDSVVDMGQGGFAAALGIYADKSGGDGSRLEGQPATEQTGMNGLSDLSSSGQSIDIGSPTGITDCISSPNCSTTQTIQFNQKAPTTEATNVTKNNSEIPPWLRQG